jgi:predicted nucleic acid-binding protein
VTAVKVVDASALAAVLFNETEAPAVAAQLMGARLIAPPLLTFEMANICVTKCRRHQDEQPLLISAFAMRALIDVQEVEIDHDRVVELAIRTGLTAYDASYLWLSRETGAELITLDRQLMRVILGQP